jgi:hypothetical protein
MDRSHKVKSEFDSLLGGVSLVVLIREHLVAVLIKESAKSTTLR